MNHLDSLFTVHNSTYSGTLQAVPKKGDSKNWIFEADVNRLGEWLEVRLSDKLYREFQQSGGIRVPKTSPSYEAIKSHCSEFQETKSFGVVPLNKAAVVTEPSFLVAMRLVWMKAGGTSGFSRNYNLISLSKQANF